MPLPRAHSELPGRPAQRGGKPLSLRRDGITPRGNRTGQRDRPGLEGGGASDEE